MNRDNKLLFVSGFPSGGTDLVKNILNAHHDIFISGEVPFLYQLPKFDFKGGDSELSLKEISDLREKIKDFDVYGRVESSASAELIFDKVNLPTLENILYEMVTDKPEKIRGFKTPQFTERMDILAELFPNALFLVVVRDVRDVCLSWENKWGKDKYLCADKWARRMHIGWKVAQTKMLDRTMFVTYEQVLSNNEVFCRDVCKFIEVEYMEEMLEFHRYVAPQEGKINYGNAIVKTNAGKWRQRLSLRDITRIEEIAYDTLKLFKYPLENAVRSQPITKYERYKGLALDVYAMFFIGNRKMTLLNNLRSRILSIFIEVQKRR